MRRWVIVLIAVFLSLCCSPAMITLPPSPIEFEPDTERVEVPDDLRPGPKFAHQLARSAASSMGFPTDCSTDRDPNVLVAATTVYYGTAACNISYNPERMNEIHDRAGLAGEVAVFAHEIGHVILSKECGGCTGGHEAELFGDRVAGCSLAVLGMPESAVMKAAQVFGEFSESRTHPRGEFREASFLAGFQECSEPAGD